MPLSELPFSFSFPCDVSVCIGGGFLDSIGHPATLMSRWCLSLEFFGRHFANDVGIENRRNMLEVGGFLVKEAAFRKAMGRIRETNGYDLVLEVSHFDYLYTCNLDHLIAVLNAFHVSPYIALSFFTVFN